MFDKLRNKLSTDNDTNSPRDSRRNSPEVPQIAIPRDSDDSEYPPSYRTRPQSSGAESKSRAQSTPGNINSQSDLSNTSSRSSTPQSSKGRRNVFWKSSLWNSKHNSSIPSGPHIRAKSSATPLPHPLIAEQQMRNLPYHDWQGKNKPDDTWDESNVARLYS